MNNKDLPTSGPLVEQSSLEITNKDLLQNSYAQNGIINEVRAAVKTLESNVQLLSTTVASHAKVIELLTTIKSIGAWMLTFMGLGGFAQLIHWLVTLGKD